MARGRATGDVERLAARAGFVFAGEVRRTGATTMDAIEPSKETAVVRVHDVLRAPADFGERKGTDVTVRLAAPARKGQRAVFFTVGLMSGTGLAVQELGRRPASDVEGLHKRTEEAVRQEDLAEVRRRIGEAEAVVIGNVVAVRPPRGRELPPASEHDPQWRIAHVVVDHVEKGRMKEGEQVEVAFPSSRDVMWFSAPKPTEGDRAILILHRRKLDELDVDALAILEPPDMQPVDQLERVREAMTRTG